MAKMAGMAGCNGSLKLFCCYCLVRYSQLVSFYILKIVGCSYLLDDCARRSPLSTSGSGLLNLELNIEQFSWSWICAAHLSAI